MFDYAAWLQRAELFLRGLNHLPGEVHVAIDIAPPLSIDEANALCASLPFALPRPLYDFYTAGSAGFECVFTWEPDEPHWPLLWEVFPEEYDVSGRPLLIPAREFDETGWARDFVKRDLDIPYPDGHLWNECVPFVAIGNGDYMALQVNRSDGRMPVLYLCHDAYDSSCAFEIASSLEQFLIDWEKLCYIGPEIWLLGHFLSEDGKAPLQSDSPKAALWREIMSGRRTV